MTSTPNQTHYLCDYECEHWLSTRITADYYDSYSKPEGFTASALLREIRLSYRLIFGDDNRAHRYFLRTARNNAKVDNFLDLYLNDLCKRVSNSTAAKTTYSKRTDFPILGPRLAVLQAYVERQNPNTVKMLWLDRRDLLRWWVPLKTYQNVSDDQQVYVLGCRNNRRVRIDHFLGPIDTCSHSSRPGLCILSHSSPVEFSIHPQTTKNWFSKINPRNPPLLRFWEMGTILTRCIPGLIFPIPLSCNLYHTFTCWNRPQPRTHFSRNHLRVWFISTISLVSSQYRGPCYSIIFAE